MKALAVFSPEKLIIGMLVVLPLMWVPFIADTLEFHKQALLLLAAPLLLLLWIAKSMKEQELSFSLSTPVIASILYIAIAGLAALFSKDQWRSVVGFGFGSHESFGTVVALVAFAFGGIVFLKEKQTVRRALGALVASAGILSVVVLLSVLGILQSLFPAVSLAAGFNTVGTLSTLAVFLSAAFLAAAALAHETNGTRHIAFVLVLGLITATLLIIRSSLAWWIIAAGMALYFLVLLRTEPEKLSHMRWWLNPPLIAGIALAFGILQPMNFVQPGNLPLEVAPNNATTLQIAKESLKERPLFGSGPATWVYDYAQFRKAQPLNNTPFWNLRFSQGSSKILSMPATHGILGLASWLAILGTILYALGKTLLRQKTQTLQQNPTTASALTAIWTVLAGAQFVTTTNMTLEFLFWFATAAVIAQLDPAMLRFSVPRSSARSAISGMIASCIAVALLLSWCLVGTRSLAGAQYARGLARAQQNEITGSIEDITRAVALDGKNDLYLRSLSEDWLLWLAQTIQSERVTSSGEDLQKGVNATLAAATQATLVAPHNVANWSQLAIVRTNLLSLGAPNIITELLDPAVEAWQKAQELEPANPFLPTQRAIVYLNAADIVQGAGEEAENQRTRYLASAEESLNHALTLKPDYAPAHFQRAMLAVRQGKTDEAIAELETAQTLQPKDLGVAAQLGVLYFNVGRFDDAKSVLTAVLDAAQSAGQEHANARYFLGLIADRKGQAEEARAHFEKILELNPDNVLIERIIKNLSEHKSALEGIENTSGLTPPPAISKEEVQTVPPEQGL